MLKISATTKEFFGYINGMKNMNNTNNSEREKRKNSI